MKYVIAIAALVLAISLPALATETIGDLKLATNFDSLMTQAQQSQKVIVLEWYTDW